MLLHNINNNILISNPYFLGIYQDESEKWDIYQDIDIFLGLEPNKNKILKLWFMLLMQ